MHSSTFLFWFLLAGLSLVGCQSSTKTDTTSTTRPLPKIELAETGVYDFGTMTEGDTVEHVFQFKNTGTFPLLINNISASCGCTTPEWSRKPIAPGDASFVRVRFNSRNKEGEQNKTVTIFANTEPAMTDIRFRAMVNPQSDAGSSKNTP